MLLEALQLPSALRINQKLTKKSFYELGNLSNAQQKLLQEQVAGIELIAQLTPDKTNMPTVQTETLEYLEIAVLRVQLKNHHADSALSNKQMQSLHSLFQKAIPYPLILLIESGEKAQVSVAEKQINQADTDSEKLVLTELLQTHWISTNNPNDIEQAFLESLNYAQLNHNNLFTFYQSFIQRLTALLIAEKTGQFKLNDSNVNPIQEQLDQQRQQLKLMQKLDKEISELKGKIASTQQFNEKVELNIKLQQLTKQLQSLKS